MARVRAQVVFQGASGVSEDRYVNTFTFVSLIPDYADHATQVADHLAARLLNVSTADGAGGLKLGEFLSPYVNRQFEIRTYDLEQPVNQREPTVFPYTLPDPITGTLGLPEECAAVVSFHGVPPVTQRKRGRIYLGPLNRHCISYASPTAPTRLDPTFMAIAVHEYATLAEFTEIGWCVLSTGARVPRASVNDPLGALLPVEHYWIHTVWMDNALDTQRRRGADPSFRQIRPVEMAGG